MRIRKQITAALCLCLLLEVMATAPRVCAQTTGDEPLFDQLSTHFQRKYLSVSALLQTVGDFQIDRSFAGNSGFSVANFRLRLYGELDHGFGYLFQTNFIGTRSILDAKLHYQISPSLIIDAGLFKSPFSAEFLTYAGNIDFVNRSQVVTALAPGRQIGVQLRGASSQKLFSYRFGMFNGNGFGSNDNNDFLYAGRVAINPALSQSSDRLELGFNVAFSKDDNVTLGGGLLSGFNGDRVLVGADARWTMGKYLLSGEIIHANLDPSIGASRDIFGFHATGGYLLNPKNQLLFRLDTFSPDNLSDDNHLLVFGYNHWPTQATEVQINYIINTDTMQLDNHQVLVNAQLGF